MKRRLMTRPQRNNSGSTKIAGVYRQVRKRELRDGTEAEYLVYSVHTVVNGKSRNTHFCAGRMPVSRATEQTCKQKAIRFRAEWEASIHAEVMGNR